MSQMLLEFVPVSPHPRWPPHPGHLQLSHRSQCLPSGWLSFKYCYFSVCSPKLQLECSFKNAFHQISPLMKTSSGFHAFRKKSKLLNVCGLSCLGPDSLYSHLLPRLICGRILPSSRNKMWGRLNPPRSVAIGPTARRANPSLCIPRVFSGSRGRLGMSPSPWKPVAILCGRKTSGVSP